MNCCQCQGIEDLFDEKLVTRELSQYRAKGPPKTTRWMIDALKPAARQGATLLDIGGGIGAVQHALLEAGAAHATDVDASQAYLRAAQSEATRRGIAERVHFRHGNFVELAHQIESADIVTLDRVICCYPDMEQLVRLSAARAKHLYGVVYPRDVWWVRIGVSLLNLIFRMQKNPFRTFVHSGKTVEALVRGEGMQRRFYRQTFIWQVIVYAREP